MNNYQKILIAITLIVMTIFLLFPPQRFVGHSSPPLYIDGFKSTEGSYWREWFTDYKVLFTQRLLPTFLLGVAFFFLAGIVKKQDK